jgi:drug/metabolite transporter (DMT)-like permease
MGLSRFSVTAVTAAAVGCMATAALLARAAAVAGGDPAAYTVTRLAAAGLVLAPLARRRSRRIDGSWSAAGLLVLCSVASTAALRSLDAGVGALLFFATVQLVMTAEGVLRGQARDTWSLGGTAATLLGMVALVGGGPRTVSAAGLLLMVIGGGAWAAYSRLGRSAEDPLAATAGNVLRAVPLAALAAAPGLSSALLPSRAALLAVGAGVVATGLGGVLWFRALRRLTASCAGAAQSVVPVVTAVGSAALLGETLGSRELVAAVMVVVGVAMVARGAARPEPAAAAPPVRVTMPACALQTSV